MPNKKKKAQPKNGFFYFMLDYQEKCQREEKKTYSFADISVMAGPDWKALSETERRHYDEVAKREKEIKSNVQGKMDTYGNSIQETARQEEDTIRSEINMRDHIDRYITEMGTKDNVAKESFFFMSSKHFCKTDEGEYVPAEIAVLHYTIADGIVDSYHAFIDPGQIPTGYKFMCKDTSENVLYVPYEKFSEANKNYSEIMKGLDGVLSREAGHNGYPIVYCFPEELEHTGHILDWLQERGRTQRVIRLRLYDASMLMSSLLRFSSVVMTERVASEWMQTSIFTYQEGTSCSYHWEIDHPENCALGFVKRIAFVLSNYLCDSYGIRVVPGRHLPINKNPSYSMIEPPQQRQSICPLGAARNSREQSQIIQRGISKYDEPDDKHYEASLSSAFAQKASINCWADKKPGTPLEPLRRPRHESFAKCAYPVQVPSPNFDDADDFPSLSASNDSRPSSAMTGYTSDVSLGMSSNTSQSSFKTISSTVQSSSVASDFTLPSGGRGIGRGRLLGNKIGPIPGKSK